MDSQKKKLQSRLQRIGDPADFTSLFSEPNAPPEQFVKKGAILFNTGDPLGRLYLIKEGFIKIYRLSEEGRETTSYLLGPGQLLGIRTLLSKDDRTLHAAEAVTALKVQTISRKDAFDRILNDPEILIELLQAYRDRLALTEKKFESFIYASTTPRVAIFLADCAEKFGKTVGKEIEIGLELTHQRIAEFVGAFRETVTLSLHRLENEGIIRVNRGRVTVLSLQRLTDYTVFGKKR
ncbi:MAG: Crp/Fnr family transcriptional regulator [bacterium]|nr:Crp/Fnr family transcriptional regulator [bacterium]